VPTTSDFADFVAEVHQRGVHRRDPFPWQQALLDGIVEAGRWPDRIDVPTGLGKTSVLDVAVFLAAVRPDLARRRTFFVVDRRIVVDEAHQHAERLREALDSAAPGSVAYAVAQALRLPDDEPGTSALEVTRMRGGVTWDARWLERPDRHAIITGTVDQVGSRLLFRGYGVTEYARSIDAALVGTDSLIVVDEAHIADPFVATTQALAELEPPGDGDVPALRRLPTVVTMSATAGAVAGSRAGSWTHTHTAADETHHVARQRLKAPKQLHLLEVRAGRTTVWGRTSTWTPWSRSPRHSHRWCSGWTG
jgi:CRISPR-associated endonuclease/helicase Cas3